MLNNSDENDSHKRSYLDDDLYSLMLHINSNGSGLLFNYYPYLEKQIGSTNNIFFTFTLKKLLQPECFPSSISVILKTWIENIYLKRCPSTDESPDVTLIESNLLTFKFDPTNYRISDHNQTIVCYSLIGVNDFGSTVETIHIYHNGLDIDSLSKIQLKDDVRKWENVYQPRLFYNNENEQTIIRFERESDSTKICHFLSIDQIPTRNNDYIGINTMKKTTKDCFNLYLQDPKNLRTKDKRPIVKYMIVPVYYIIAPSSCQFGPPDTIKPTECDETTLKGTIIDPDVQNRIQLAYAHGDVLRSPPMLQLNRYLRRTFYFVDESDTNNDITRYLFCGEYPYILSVLDQLEKCGKISKAQKYDEYLRFCNMLQRLLQFSNLSDSIKLIQFNDNEIQYDENGELNHIGYADFQSPWEQIKFDINRWYQTTDDSSISSSIESKILRVERNHHVILFYPNQTREDALLMDFIHNLKDKLKSNDYIVDDAEGNLDFIDTDKQLIFICTGSKYDEINRLIMNAVQKKIYKSNVFRDVFILINDAIRYFPCRFLQSIPYLTFEFHSQPVYLDSSKIEELLWYLNNMNIMSKMYSDVFEHNNHLLVKSSPSCTSIGEGCAGAFYFNYAKLILSVPDHYRRIETVRQDFLNEYQHEFEIKRSIFISKWIFVIPWTIEDTSKVLSNAVSISKNEKQAIGYELSIWKTTNSNLTITVGGIFQRSYSPLVIYKLTCVDDGKTFYFPLEIPAALHGLDSQYENAKSHFHFGNFDPLEQGNVFRRKVEEFLANDLDKTWHDNILLVPLDKPHRIESTQPANSIQRTRILLHTLWRQLSSSIPNI